MIILRHVALSMDMDKLFKLYSDLETRFLFTNLLQIKSKDDFCEWFHFQVTNRFHEFRVIEDKGIFAGFCYSYDYQPDGVAKTAVCVSPEYRSSGIGAVGELLFLDELFRMYPIRKIYNHVYAYNENSLRSNLDGGFEIEGQLKEYRFLDGAYHDLFILAITREKFYCLHNDTLNTIRRNRENDQQLS